MKYFWLLFNLKNATAILKAELFKTRVCPVTHGIQSSSPISVEWKQSKLLSVLQSCMYCCELGWPVISWNLITFKVSAAAVRGNIVPTCDYRFMSTAISASEQGVLNKTVSASCRQRHPNKSSRIRMLLFRAGGGSIQQKLRSWCMWRDSTSSVEPGAELETCFNLFQE